MEERWRDHFYPPNFEDNMALRNRLEEHLMEGTDDDPDKMRSLEEFVEVRAREAARKGWSWQTSVNLVGGCMYACVCLAMVGAGGQDLVP